MILCPCIFQQDFLLAIESLDRDPKIAYNIQPNWMESNRIVVRKLDKVSIEKILL